MPRASPDGEDLADITQALRSKHGCHTAILYGSFARGDATEQSDYDVAGFSSTTTVVRVAGKWRNSYVDVFVYPESKLTLADAELLHLRGGIVLFERGGAGTRLLSALDQTFTRGPIPLPPDELLARRCWAWKMLDRAARGDEEGNYRRAWLLTALLEDYFHLRQMWFLGPKSSLAWLKSNAPEVHAAFELALRPGAPMGTMNEVVELVVGARSEGTVNEELMGVARGAAQPDDAFRVRPFAERDRIAVAAIYRECRAEAKWLPAAVRETSDFARDTEGEALLVAVGSEDEPLGFVSVWEQDAFIHHLYVRRGSRHRGVGKELLDSLGSRLPKPWRLKCLSSNGEARAFYISQGWKEVSSDVGEDGPFALLEKQES